jgi:hypothetical protein
MCVKALKEEELSLSATVRFASLLRMRFESEDSALQPA